MPGISCHRLKCPIIGVPLRAGGIDGRPVDLGERRTGFQALDEVRVGDEGAAEGDEIGKPVGYQAVAALALIWTLATSVPSKIGRKWRNIPSPISGSSGVPLKSVLAPISNRCERP